MTREPMTLVTQSVQEAAPQGVPVQGIVWGGVAMVLMAGLAGLAGVLLKRAASRRADPYERLLARLCRSAGVPAAAQERLRIRAGGEAKRAVGMLLSDASRPG